MTTPLSKQCTAFLAAPNPLCESMNMFLSAKSQECDNAPNPLPLVIVGSTSQFGVYDALSMFVDGGAMGHAINLFVHGHDSGGTSAVVGMFVGGGNASLVGNVPFFVQNGALSLDDDFPMFVQGDGLNPGYSPVNESLNMFVKRGPNSGMALFLCNNGVEFSMPLFVGGVPVAGDSVSMFVMGTGGDVNNDVPMFIKVGSPTGVDDSVTMAIPVTTGIQSTSITLYVNGFNY